MNGINEIRSASYEVDEYLFLNPSAAEEITAFSPTRSKVVQIVKFWYRQALREQWEFFLYQDFLDCDAGLEYFANPALTELLRF